jgi:PhnB protein
MVLDSAASASFPCSIAPWLSVRKSAQAVDFYKSAFGATEVFRLEDPGGSVVARLSVDGAEFWLSDESPEHGNWIIPRPSSCSSKGSRRTLRAATQSAR